MDLNECFRKGLIKKTLIDNNLIYSLIEMSNIKQKTVESATINSFNVSAYVSLAYDSLRELLECVCISKGFKVISHICISELLREEFTFFDYMSFDRLRRIRNNINYYGKKIELREGQIVIKSIFKMNKKILNKFLVKFVT